MSNTSTSVALFTPPGRGALATIAVHGPRAWEIVDGCLATPVPALRRTERPWLRQFRGAGDAAEELVVAFPAEYEARVHCHGGPAACEAVLRAIEEAGAIRAMAPVEPISQALTERTALILLDQRHGALTREIEQVISSIRTGDVHQAARRLDGLIALAPLGLHLTTPWHVVIAGRPNAGKSSLLNALLGFQRSIVNRQPGTTRDVVTALTAFDGWPVELRDTAGLRPSQDPVEAAGVELAGREIEEADLILLVVPADEPLTDVDHELAGALAARRRGEAALLTVRSKIDLALHQKLSADEIGVSAVTGANLDSLVNRIATSLVPNSPEARSAVPFTAEQVAALRTARDALTSGKLEEAAKSLGYLTGRSCAISAADENIRTRP